MEIDVHLVTESGISAKSMTSASLNLIKRGINAQDLGDIDAYMWRQLSAIIEKTPVRWMMFGLPTPIFESRLRIFKAW